MATKEQTHVLSTPKVMVDGRVVKVIPNSVKFKIPGEAKVRAVSAGGAAVEVVQGLNAEALLGHVAFSIATTRENVDLVRLWKAKMINGEQCTIRLIFPTAQFSYQQMFFSKDTDVEAKSDGTIQVEFEGQYVP